mgnify:CR=1 FL=1
MGRPIKSKYFGNDNIMITDRGTSFGYNTLISDMRGLDIMREFGAPIIYDATHSVQQPGGMGGTSGGDRRFVSVLGRAALAATKIAGIFAEVHQESKCQHYLLIYLHMKFLNEHDQQFYEFSLDIEYRRRSLCTIGALHLFDLLSYQAHFVLDLPK